jgi:hypothetical protein
VPYAAPLSRERRASQPQESRALLRAARRSQRFVKRLRVALAGRSFALRQPKEQFDLIKVVYHKCWSAPLEDGRLDALFLDMFAKCIYLVVIKANE